ncbi:hypothetical protein FOCC_FOCC016448, partial [Frankliniella occidentalis]
MLKPASLLFMFQTPPHPQLLGDSLLAPPDWPPLLFLSPGSDLQPYPTGYQSGYSTGYQSGYPVGYPDRTRKALGYEPAMGHEVDHTLSHPMDHAVDHAVEYTTDYPMWAHRIVYPPDPCSPPYSPFGFCDYSVLDMMPLARPVAAVAGLSDPGSPPSGPPGPSPPGPPAYADLTELHPYMQPMPYRTPMGGPSDLADMEALIKQEDFSGQETEHQAALRRMMCSEPVIIQENERIC